MASKWNLKKIYKLFNCGETTELNDTIISQLVQWNMIPKEGDFLCAKGHPLKLVESPDVIDGYIWRCRKKTKSKMPKVCNEKISLRAATFFDKSKLSIMQILVIVHMWTRNMSQDDIIAEAELGSRHTAVDWCNFYREVVYHEFVIKKQKLGGPNITIEIDESKFGRRKYYRGHAVEGQWVFGGVERGTNKCFLVLAIIKDWILPGTTIVSDFWKAYDCLSDEGYEHYKVNHSLHFKDPDTQQHTNTIEGLWRHAKYSMPQYHSSKKMFDGYLAKFMFRRYCKSNDLDAFVLFLKFAGDLYNPLAPQLYEDEEDCESEYEIEII